MPDKDGNLTEAEKEAMRRVQEDLRREAENAERSARDNEN